MKGRCQSEYMTLPLELVHIAFYQNQAVAKDRPQCVNSTGLLDVIISVVVQDCLERHRRRHYQSLLD